MSSTSPVTWSPARDEALWQFLLHNQQVADRNLRSTADETWLLAEKLKVTEFSWRDMKERMIYLLDRPRSGWAPPKEVLEKLGKCPGKLDTSVETDSAEEGQRGGEDSAEVGEKKKAEASSIWSSDDSRSNTPNLNESSVDATPSPQRTKRKAAVNMTRYWLEEVGPKRENQKKNEIGTSNETEFENLERNMTMDTSVESETQGSNDISDGGMQIITSPERAINTLKVPQVPRCFSKNLSKKLQSQKDEMNSSKDGSGTIEDEIEKDVLMLEEGEREGRRKEVDMWEKEKEVSRSPSKTSLSGGCMRFTHRDPETLVRSCFECNAQCEPKIKSFANKANKTVRKWRCVNMKCRMWHEPVIPGDEQVWRAAQDKGFMSTNGKKFLRYAKKDEQTLKRYCIECNAVCTPVTRTYFPVEHGKYNKIAPKKFVRKWRCSGRECRAFHENVTPEEEEDWLKMQKDCGAHVVTTRYGKPGLWSKKPVYRKKTGSPAKKKVVPDKGSKEEMEAGSPIKNARKDEITLKRFCIDCNTECKPMTRTKRDFGGPKKLFRKWKCTNKNCRTFHENITPEEEEAWLKMREEEGSESLTNRYEQLGSKIKLNKTHKESSIEESPLPPVPSDDGIRTRSKMVDHSKMVDSVNIEEAVRMCRHCHVTLRRPTIMQHVFTWKCDRCQSSILPSNIAKFEPMKYEKCCELCSKPCKVVYNDGKCFWRCSDISCKFTGEEILEMGGFSEENELKEESCEVEGPPKKKCEILEGAVTNLATIDEKVETFGGKSLESGGKSFESGGKNLESGESLETRHRKKRKIEENLADTSVEVLDISTVSEEDGRSFCNKKRNERPKCEVCEKMLHPRVIDGKYLWCCLNKVCTDYRMIAKGQKHVKFAKEHKKCSHCKKISFFVNTVPSRDGFYYKYRCRDNDCKKWGPTIFPGELKMEKAVKYRMPCTRCNNGSQMKPSYFENLGVYKWKCTSFRCKYVTRDLTKQEVTKWENSLDYDPSLKFKTRNLSPKKPVFKNVFKVEKPRMEKPQKYRIPCTRCSFDGQMKPVYVEKLDVYRWKCCHFRCRAIVRDLTEEELVKWKSSYEYLPREKVDTEKICNSGLPLLFERQLMDMVRNLTNAGFPVPKSLLVMFLENFVDEYKLVDSEGPKMEINDTWLQNIFDSYQFSSDNSLGDKFEQKMEDVVEEMRKTAGKMKLGEGSEVV